MSAYGMKLLENVYQNSQITKNDPVHYNYKQSSSSKTLILLSLSVTIAIIFFLFYMPMKVFDYLFQNFIITNVTVQQLSLFLKTL